VTLRTTVIDATRLKEVEEEVATAAAAAAAMLVVAAVTATTTTTTSLDRATSPTRVSSAARP
jgi:hypothetical protein